MNSYPAERLLQKFPGQLRFDQHQDVLIIYLANDLLFNVASFLKTDQDLLYLNLVAMGALPENAASPYFNNQVIYQLSSYYNLPPLLLVTTNEPEAQTALKPLWPFLNWQIRQLFPTSDSSFKQHESGVEEITLPPQQHQLGWPVTIKLGCRDNHIIQANIIPGLSQRQLPLLVPNLTLPELLKLLASLDSYNGPVIQLAAISTIEEAAAIRINESDKLLRSTILLLCQLGAGLFSLQTRLKFLGLANEVQEITRLRINWQQLLPTCLTGSTPLTFARCGGWQGQLSAKGLHNLANFLNSLIQFLQKYQKRILGNYSVITRLKGLGFITTAQWHDYGFSSHSSLPQQTHWSYFATSADYPKENNTDALERMAWLFHHLESVAIKAQLLINDGIMASTISKADRQLTWDHLALVNRWLSTTFIGPCGQISVTIPTAEDGHPLTIIPSGESVAKLAILESLMPKTNMADIRHLLASLIVSSSEIDY